MKYKNSYYALSLISVGFTSLNSLMIITFFGASQSADSYLLALAIVGALQMIQLLLVDQFLYFYEENRRQEKAVAFRFFTVCWQQSTLAGIFFVALCFYLTPYLLTLFASGLDQGRRQETELLLQLLLISSALFTPNFIMHRVLNSESKISLPYIFEMVIPICCLLSFGSFALQGNANVTTLASARVAGQFIAFFLANYSCWRLGYFHKVSIFSKIGIPCYKNSFSMRSGHNIHNFLFSPITNTVLSMLPAGSISIYYYADRLSQVVAAVVVGPVQRVYQVQISRNWINGSAGEKLISLAKSYLNRTAILFTAVATALYFVIPPALMLFASHVLSAEQMGSIQTVFGVLAIWTGITALEFTVVAMCLAAKNSRLLFVTNSLFILNYSL